ncbi:hypothetical protein RirG_199790 [Rhizophagus irregularis DAOM 197198w]|uniref:Uncharacterized protein n=1 Tax=Rhizophagus irregularis (strain DAOM 197198w) TaxID=1432141 RepID=A0A015IM09_RHIIW|nr:hypothetical protein RirG_199790 [Rhizophagus irregularis DAOM 197198w]
MSKVSEEKLKELRESIRSTIDWGAYSKWIAEGEPYEEHEEVLLFLNQKKHESEIAYSKPDDDITLTEEEDIIMEELLTEVPERPIKRPGKRAIISLQPREPKPPPVTMVNIVVKSLDPTKFPIQQRYITKTLNDLNNAGILNNVIGLNVKGKIREFNKEKTKLHPAVSVHDIVPKGLNMYALILPDGQYLILRHIRGRWFRCLAFFTDHNLYSDFLNNFFTNSMNIYNNNNVS